MEANFNRVKKLVYNGTEYVKAYAGYTQIWIKPPSFVVKPLPRNKKPDIIDGVTAKWTIDGITPNKTYQISITGVRNGIMRVSQTALGNSDLRIAGANSGLASASINVTSPNGIIYVTMSDVYTGTPELTLS
ncbi:hypothetical protein [Staphylococcus aureus]|uniref:hypothetical protein n=1 Tax=Staphylococcus aureus TaxID=1280 RepID=UPI00052ADAEF|nr:hypothetical protein [Staphylococcus aureus]MCO4443322.1 hypothetical protein [Staphylococcus aureus]UXS92201.1 hypothetical protein MUA64_05650 [Staphylococcus aureus]UXS94874.1 hypothetical protein MUA08_05755 [Staphylococcus aureus]UXT55741.1 hypothetical protein MUA45_06080 [Staphylococcus aureus]UXU24529.1 hypothetical protein MUA79_06165 [Staphylococcus aureus]